MVVGWSWIGLELLLVFGSSGCVLGKMFCNGFDGSEGRGGGVEGWVKLVWVYDSSVGIGGDLNKILWDFGIWIVVVEELGICFMVLMLLFRLCIFYWWGGWYKYYFVGV